MRAPAPGPAAVAADAAQPAAAGAAAEAATPVVQLRSFPLSTNVHVVAWEVGDSGWGLRSVLRGDGTLVRDHTIYVSALYDPGVSRLRKAVLHGKLLLLQGRATDRLPCWDDTCTPSSYFVARIREDLLRASRDDLTVHFQGDEDREFTIHIATEVVDAYLQAVDSVRAARRSSGD
jgi:hypothetical protein